MKDVDDWIKFCVDQPIYEQQQALAKFLLLLAAHHAVPDGTTGLTKQGMVADHTAMLLPERWDDERFATVEHVAPQTPPTTGAGWDEEIYSRGGWVHRVGNLTLVPTSDNSSLSNRPWREKRHIYRALASPDVETAQSILDDAAADNVPITPTYRNELLGERRYLPVLEAVGQFDGVWSTEFIGTRSEHLLRRSWTILNDWINPT